MGLIWGKPAEWETTKSVEESIEKGYAFYFKGCHLYLMTTHCHMCKKLRFTPEEVDILSNENLTKEEFDKKFGLKMAHTFICNDQNCAIKLFKISGGNNFYYFEYMWDFIEQMKVAEERKRVIMGGQSKIKHSETDDQNQSLPN